MMLKITSTVFMNFTRLLKNLNKNHKPRMFKGINVSFEYFHL